ncbi:LOW QUALITY PROTEIN: polymeric immunoglobulin receptor-like [Emydura macquarii macquarii]|uniref:LOW QUALITY PROTEIN: polymeric immunoglobulin receptor-like n=1 Tax=Emydura macquarii macquarii TaxID=1129001 RepID=UPI00352BB61E
MEKLMHLVFLVSLSELCVAENITVVYGLEGETISIRCAYSPKENKWREKSWCKHINKTECQHVVSAHRFWLQFLKKWNGTTSIADNIHKGVITVTMEKLQKQDAGLYQCKTDFLGEARSLKKVKVEVLGADLTETQASEEPRAEHSISSLPEAPFNILYITAGFLGAKFLTAVLIFIIASTQKSRATRQRSHNLNQHQLLPSTGDLVSIHMTELAQPRRPEAAFHVSRTETTSHYRMGRFPAQLLLLALTGLCFAGEDLEIVRRVQGGTFTTVCHYNMHKYSQGEKFWCKELSDTACHNVVLSSPAAGRNYINTNPNARVSLKDSGTGWISVSMTELRVEDSGIYWCGVSDHLKIIPLKKIKMAVSYEAPATLSVKEGDSISLNCSYFVMDNSRSSKNFTWCKMVTATRCHPVISVEFYQIVNTQGRTRIMIDRKNKVVIVTLAKLQLRDSGEYHCESHLQGSTTLLKMITLNVLESYDRMDFLTTSLPIDNIGAILPNATRNDEQSWYSEASFNVLYVMAGLLGTKFLTALLIFIVASNKRSRATGQEMHGRNKYQLLPLTGVKKEKKNTSKTRM